MPDIVDGYKDKFSDYYKSLRNRLRRKKYSLKKYIDSFKEYGSAYGGYALFELAPFVVAYGLMINFPLSVLLGMAFTVKSVVSWGLVFYFVSEELVDIVNELKPYVRVSAKVDNN